MGVGDILDRYFGIKFNILMVVKRKATLLSPFALVHTHTHTHTHTIFHEGCQNWPMHEFLPLWSEECGKL
jgi:hypothetical protein